MDYLPIFLDIKQRRCIVVGGGEIAVRKADMLLKAGAHVVIISPEIEAEIQIWLDKGKIEYIKSKFKKRYLKKARLVIAATDDESINQQVHEMAEKLNIPVNVVDQKPLCTFITPSIVDRSPIMIATSSGGQSPVLARKIREQLESTIPADYGKLARVSGEFRDELKQNLPEINQRRYFWENVLNGPVAERIIKTTNDNDARTLLKQALSEQKDELLEKKGEVYLVGAGPGDPDLLTFRALRLMQQADVVLHDRLVSDDILNLVRRDAERIYVGKRCDNHVMRQEDINQLMVDRALAGERVCRLKGGDPFIFGRGGEELQILTQHNIPFQVVPAVTAAAACSAYAGIPLTHRDHAQSLTFITGHLKAQKNANGETVKEDTFDHVNWQALAKAEQTIVFYMGLKNLAIICKQLIDNGADAQLPAALIENGSRANQRVAIGTLSTLNNVAKEKNIGSPALLIIGTVVSLRDELKWFGNET